MPITLSTATGKAKVKKHLEVDLASRGGVSGPGHRLEVHVAGIFRNLPETRQTGNMKRLDPT